MKPWGKISRFFRRQRLDAEMAEEMREHLERRTQANLAAGMSMEEARYAARRQFGGVEQIKECAREQSGFWWLERPLQDLRFGVRSLRKNPGFTLVAVLTLALGIGATTAIFSVAYAVVLRPLPFPESERLMAIWTRTPQVERLGMAAADHRDLQAQNTVFEDVAIFRGLTNYNLSGFGDSERITAAQIPANFLPLLHVSPMLGRGFTADETQAGRDRVVILGYDFWQRRYGGDPAIVDRTITLEGISHTVVGVMGAGFRYPSREVQIWTPLTINPADFQTRTGYSHQAIARLKSGVTRLQAQTELDVIGSRLAPLQGGRNGDVRFDLRPLRQDLASVARKPLMVLLGAAFGLLFIGCFNLVNLLLARALARSREVAVRAALGASRSRLLQQAAAELMPILVLGGVGGVLAAKAGVALMLPWLPPSLPRLHEVQMSFPVLLFSGALFLLTAAVVLLLPAAQERQLNLAKTLGDNSRTSAGGGRNPALRSALLIGQVALAVMLLAGAGLLARSFAAVRQVDPGFRAEGVLSLRLAISREQFAREPRDQGVAAFSRLVLDEVRALPGVEAAGMGNRLLLSGTSGLSTVFYERRGGAPGALAGTDETSVTPDYFRTLGIRLLRGRTFAESDKRGAPEVVIVDEEVARLAWPSEDPIGQRMRSSPNGPWAQVVGVVAHIRHESLERDERRQIYWNYLQRERDRTTLFVRSVGDARLLAKPVMAAIKKVDAGQTVYEVRTLAEVVDDSLALRWFNTVVVSLFASSSLLLAMMGVYGVISYAIHQRTREIGVRVALGASRGGVLGLILWQGGKLVGVGILLGLLGAAAFSRLLGSLLFGISPFDPVTFAVVPLLLLAAALIACWVPARRATKIDPMVALRAE